MLGQRGESVSVFPRRRLCSPTKSYCSHVITLTLARQLCETGQLLNELPRSSQTHVGRFLINHSLPRLQAEIVKFTLLPSFINSKMLMYMISYASLHHSSYIYATFLSAADLIAPWISASAPSGRGSRGDRTVACSRMPRATRACFRATVPSM